MRKTIEPVDAPCREIVAPKKTAISVSTPSAPIMPMGIKTAITKACELMPAVLASYESELRATLIFRGADTGEPDYAARHRAADAIRELAYGKSPLITVYNSAEDGDSRRIGLKDMSDAEIELRATLKELTRAREKQARENARRKIEAIDMMQSQVIIEEKKEPH